MTTVDLRRSRAFGRARPAPMALALVLSVGCGGESRSGAVQRDVRGEAILVGTPEAERMGTEQPPSEVQSANPEASALDPAVAPSAQQRLARGADVFLENCASCHQGGGQGIEGEVPALAGSDFLNADKARALEVVANGLDGDFVVDGHAFANRMPSLGLSDEDIADVLTYVFSEWGNAGLTFTPEEVGAARR